MTVQIDQGILGLSGIGLAPSGTTLPTGDAFFSVYHSVFAQFLTKTFLWSSRRGPRAKKPDVQSLGKIEAV
jgi:hypothetical protein